MLKPPDNTVLNVCELMISVTFIAILQGGHYYFYTADKETKAQLTITQQNWENATLWRLGSDRAYSKES